MKKRIVSMILALSMVLSILPVSAFADAGTSAAAAETTAAGTNEETTNPVVKIKIGADGLPEEQSGTGWSYDSSNNWLTITGVENAKKEYVFDGDASCKVAIATSSNEVYLRDGVVNGQLWIKNPNACVLGGSYAEAVLENGTIDGGTYGKLTENGGSNRWHVRHHLPACRYQQRLLGRLCHGFHQCRRYNDLCRGQYVPAAFKEQRAHSTDPDPVYG